MSALEVVYKRLSQVGLADYCLTLHSHNAKRREVLNQFDRLINISRQRVDLQPEALGTLQRLTTTRETLNQYADELHTIVEPLGKSIYQVNGYIAQLEGYPNIDYIQMSPDTFTPKQLTECEIALEDIAQVVSKSGYQQNNPWAGCILEQPPTHQFRQQFAANSSNLVSNAETGKSIFSKTDELLDTTGSNWAFTSIPTILNIFELAKLSPKVKAQWITLDLHEQIISIDHCIRYLDSCIGLKDKLSILQEEFEFMNATLKDKTPFEARINMPKEIKCAIDHYNASLEEKEVLSREKATLDSKVKSALQVLKSCEHSLIEQQEKESASKNAWQSAQSNLFERCAETVLSVDASNMLDRYRSDYNSWIRIFKSAYRDDRNSLLMHCLSEE